MSKKVSLKERENLEHVCVCVVVFVSAMRERERGVHETERD